jgi:hypothetical protein
LRRDVDRAESVLQREIGALKVVGPQGYACSMTATQFATELKVCGLRMFDNQIVSDECPGIAWKPVMTRGQIDRVGTLREDIRERREVIVRQARIGMA